MEKEAGKLQKVEKWGKKRLAYKIGRHREGSYVLIVAEGGSGLVKEVERRLRVTDGVIKFTPCVWTKSSRPTAAAAGRWTTRSAGRVPRPAPMSRSSSPRVQQ
jgi:ribosomal protein S6